MDYSPARVTFCRILWHKFFKIPTDTIDGFWNSNVKFIREQFFGYKWFEIYDFIEFCALNLVGASAADRFMKLSNNILERESAGYRFVSNKITPISSRTEIESIEEAIESSRSAPGIAIHLNTALQYLSDRHNPDFRNSIKESISAVESLCRLVTGSEKATLGDALKKIEGMGTIHPALKQAFSKLYGYTSDSQGIRHALIDASTQDFHEAKFMLVTCSAFINYVLGIQSKNPRGSRET